MIITYIPSGKTYTLENPTMREIINQTDRISPLEQSQYKKFEFEVSDAEKNTVMEYYYSRQAMSAGLPVKKIKEISPKNLQKIYLSDIGSIKFK